MELKKKRLDLSYDKIKEILERCVIVDVEDFGEDKITLKVFDRGEGQLYLLEIYSREELAVEISALEMLI